MHQGLQHPDASQYARSLIEASLDPLVTIAVDGTITDVNTATEKVTGVPRDQLIGSDFTSYFTDPQAARDGYQQAFSAGQVTDYPLAIRHTNGTTTEVVYNATVYRNPNGEVAGVFAAARDVTELNRAQADLQRTAQYARSLIEASLDPLVTIAVDGTITDVNTATEKVTGVPRDQLIGSDFTSYFTDPQAARDGYRQAFSAGQVTDYPLAIRHTNGTTTEVVYNATVYRNPNGEVAGVFAAARDVTELNRAQADLAAETQLRVAMDNSAIGMAVMASDGRFLRVNPTLCRMLGRDPEELTNLNWRDITHPDDLALSTGLMAELLSGRTASFRTLSRYLTTAGAVIWGDVSVAGVPSGSGGSDQLIVQIVDVTDRVTAEQQLTAMATQDPLTGLANRHALGAEIDRALAVGRQHSQLTAVLMVDLDRFKNVNDSLGHPAGDELLREVATRIRAAVRAADMVARTGGDEFVIVMSDLASAREAVAVAERIVATLRPPIHSMGTQLSATASVGVAIAGAESTAEDLLREADTAMYRAKEDGRDRAVVFNEELRTSANHRLNTEGQLRAALELDQLAVWYQPEVDLTTGAVRAAEALVRWHHPDGTWHPAAQFIDIAEDCGLILQIGEWVIRAACQQAAQWARELPELARLTVRLNLSTRQLAEPGLRSVFESTISDSGVDPGQLCVEITETSLLHDTANAATNLAWLRKQGIRIAVDDFGTGLASLAYLRDLPVDVLKIDRSYIANMTGSERGRHLVAGILALAGAMGLEVTAEGVESADQETALRALGCTSAQGYLFSKAVPGTHFPLLLDRHVTAVTG